MKIVILCSGILLYSMAVHSQNVGIGIATPAASAMLDVSSTSKGFLPPRMTQAQRNAIATPAAGLMVWCTDCSAGGELDMYNGTGWINYKLTAIPPLPNILICGQVWMGKNLDVSTYKNGDPIPQVTDAAAWTALTTGAYCYYNNDSVTYAATYGKLYNWYAVNDPRGLAPAGWHIPSDAEWTTLSNCLGGDAVAGGAMKDTGMVWAAPNLAATNSSGFKGVAGGWRLDNDFEWVAKYGYWWSATETVSSFGGFAGLRYTNGNLNRNFFYKRMGFSVRCLRD